MQTTRRHWRREEKKQHAAETSRNKWWRKKRYTRVQHNKTLLLEEEMVGCETLSAQLFWKWEKKIPQRKGDWFHGTSSWPLYVEMLLHLLVMKWVGLLQKAEFATVALRITFQWWKKEGRKWCTNTFYLGWHTYWQMVFIEPKNKQTPVSNVRGGGGGLGITYLRQNEVMIHADSWCTPPTWQPIKVWGRNYLAFSRSRMPGSSVKKKICNGDKVG